MWLLFSFNWENEGSNAACGSGDEKRSPGMIENEGQVDWKRYPGMKNDSRDAWKRSPGMIENERRDD